MAQTAPIYSPLVGKDQHVHDNAWIAWFKQVDALSQSPSLSGALLKANNLSDVASVSASRTNLGLGVANAPQFAGLNLTSLTASQLVGTDGSKNLISLSPSIILSYIGLGPSSSPTFAGLTLDALNGILRGNFGNVLTVNVGASLQYDGTTLDTIQDIQTTASPIFAGLILSPNTAELLLYNITSTDYERAYAKWDSNVFKIGTEAGGSGTIRDIEFLGGSIGIGLVPAQKLDISGKIALDGTTVAYRPTTLTDTLILGNGGTNLSHTAGTDGYDNTIVGLDSGVAMTTGCQNVAVGSRSLYSCTIGSDNFALGTAALYNLIDGSRNIAIGYSALYFATSAVANIGIGWRSLLNNISGTDNIAIGSQALTKATASYNVAIGTSALQETVSGASNVAIGVSALQAVLAGDNVAIGQNAGWLIAGDAAENTTGVQSVFVGKSTRPLADGDANEIVIGYGTTGAGSNTATLGNASITSTVLRGVIKIANLTASLPVVTDGSSNLVSLAYTGATSFRKNLGLEISDSPTFTKFFTSSIGVGIGTISPSATSILHVYDPTYLNYFLIGDRTDTTDNNRKGVGFVPYSTGSIYIDHKTYTGGTINWRAGSGIQLGSQNTFMSVAADTANITFIRQFTSAMGSGFGITSSVSSLAIAQFRDSAHTHYFYVGDETDDSTDNLVGLRFAPYSDGNIYWDFKTYSAKSIIMRCGGGTEKGSKRIWLNITSADGLVTIPLGLGVGSTTTPSELVHLNEVKTITGAVADGYSAALRLDPGYTAATAQTVTRHNYIDVQDVSNAGAGPSAVTDSCVLRFDANAGTHKALAGTGGGVACTIGDGPTGANAGNPVGWIKMNINGAIRVVPFW